MAPTSSPTAKGMAVKGDTSNKEDKNSNSNSPSDAPVPSSPLIHCQTDAEGNYGVTSDYRRTVRFEYEIESHLEGVLLNVELEQLERRISQELLPVLFDGCHRRRRRLVKKGAVGLSEAPKDFLVEGKTCEAWKVDMANSCHVVQGQFTAFYEENARVEPLEELLSIFQPSVFENKNLARVSLREVDDATAVPATQTEQIAGSINWAMYGSLIGVSGSVLLLAFAVVWRQRRGEKILRSDISDILKEKESPNETSQQYPEQQKQNPKMIS